MRIFYTAFSILVLSIIIVSCSKDTDSVSEKNEASSNYIINDRAQGFDYYTANQKLIDDINTNGEPSFPMNQNTVDYYLDVAGYDGGVDAQTANALMDEASVVRDLGLEKYMDERLDLQEFTKQTVLKITTTGPILDIASQREFMELPKKERKIILGVNDIADSYFKNLPKGGRTVTADNILGAVSFGASFFMAGMAFCGPPCGIVGGILGGVWGWFTGIDGQK